MMKRTVEHFNTADQHYIALAVAAGRPPRNGEAEHGPSKTIKSVENQVIRTKTQRLDATGPLPLNREAEEDHFKAIRFAEKQAVHTRVQGFDAAAKAQWLRGQGRPTQPLPVEVGRRAVRAWRAVRAAQVTAIAGLVVMPVLVATNHGRWFAVAAAAAVAGSAVRQYLFLPRAEKRQKAAIEVLYEERLTNTLR